MALTKQSEKRARVRVRPYGMQPPLPHSRVMKSLRKPARAAITPDKHRMGASEAELEAEIERLLKEINAELRALNAEIASYEW